MERCATSQESMDLSQESRHPYGKGSGEAQRDGLEAFDDGAGIPNETDPPRYLSSARRQTGAGAIRRMVPMGQEECLRERARTIGADGARGPDSRKAPRRNYGPLESRIDDRFSGGIEQLVFRY